MCSLRFIALRRPDKLRQGSIKDIKSDRNRPIIAVWNVRKLLQPQTLVELLDALNENDARRSHLRKR